MYESVSSVVRQGLEVSEVIHQHVGLRQGCILSPCLFSLFIADFPKYLEDCKCIGVKLHDEWVRVLLYADDGALVARSVEDLQCMLNALQQYCAKWRLFVNTSKTKVMIFNRNTRVTLHDNMPMLMYDGATLEVVDEFKYLGVMFHSSNIHAALEHRIIQGKRLVAAWMRRCQVWCFKPDVAVSQFKTCVMPALEYGVGLWGVGTYESAAWERLEIFWRYIARCILGVSSRAPNGGVYGDLGWHPFYTRATWQATSFFTRITEMSDKCLVRKAMYVQRDMVTRGNTCWLSAFKDTLCNTTCGSAFWNEWWSKPNFRCVCERVEIDSQGNQEGKAIRWEEGVYDGIKQVAIDVWKLDVSRVTARRGEGGNKLRTYNLFKDAWGYEPYLTFLDNRDQRVLVTKFRIGICPLRIETGRYENDGSHEGIPAHERTCLVCDSVTEIEDEMHFLLKCPKYEHFRRSMLESITIACSKIDINSMNTPCLFTEIMASKDKGEIQCVAKYLWDAFHLRETLLVEEARN